MKCKLKIVLIGISVLLIASALVGCSGKADNIPGINVMDGDGMVYTWPDYNLYGNWTEVNVPEEFKPGSIEIDESTITIDDGYGTKSKYKYSIPDGVDREGVPEGEVYLEIEDLKDFENLIFHIEELEDDGGYIAVLSGTVFEYDGRGEIIITEYVRDENLYRVPSDFKSSMQRSRNSWDGVPHMFKTVNPNQDVLAEPETETKQEQDIKPQEADILEDGGEEMNIPMQAMPGGSSNRTDANAPKVIKSTDLTYFSADCNFITMANAHKYTYIYAYAAKADAGTIVAFRYNKDSGGSQALQTESMVTLVSGDILSELHQTVTKYDLVRNNGQSNYVNGLPQSFGGSVHAEYSSGEYISFSDNQSPVISPDAADEIIDIIRKYAEKSSVRPLSVDDIAAVTYSEDRGEANYTIECLEETKLMTESRYGADGKIYKSDYDAPADTMDKIRRIADDNALLYYEGISETEPDFVSIANSKLTFTMNDGCKIEVRDSMKKPAQAGNCIFDIHMIFMEAEKNKTDQ